MSRFFVSFPFFSLLFSLFPIDSTRSAKLAATCHWKLQSGAQSLKVSPPVDSKGLIELRPRKKFPCSLTVSRFLFSASLLLPLPVLCYFLVIFSLFLFIYYYHCFFIRIFFLEVFFCFSCSCVTLCSIFIIFLFLLLALFNFIFMFFLLYFFLFSFCFSFFFFASFLLWNDLLLSF